MLVLTRKRTEQIKIGKDIVITVIQIARGHVKLGIQAPANVRVLRAELDNRPAAGLNVDVENTEEAELVDLPMFSAERFLNDFDTDYLADVEDQALLCLTR